MATIKPNTRDEIATLALSQISFCRDKKEIKRTNWYKNEDLYYSKKINLSTERANVNLNEAQSFAQTFLSKINTPFNWRYIKGDEADLQAAKIMNAIREKDAKLGNWNYKAMLARTQLVIYGRYIFEYHADSIDNKYDSHLTNVDVYQFLIDPSCGGEDIEKAWYMGRGGIVKTRRQIEEGVRKGMYLRKEAEELLSGDGQDQDTQEDDDTRNRYITMINGDRVMHSKDNYNFFEWYTTYNGDRYYCLISEYGKMLKCCLLTDIFPTNKYPFWTVAAYPDLTEFWTPSPLDGVREAIMAKSVAINQMLDNAEAINRPMRAFDVGAIENPALLKFRKDGLIPVKSGFDVQKAIQSLPVIPLNTSLVVYDKLDNIIATQSGVTNGARGNANEDKVGIYEGNQANAADRFALVQESEANGQKRFAELYLEGVEEHMTNKYAIQMIGLDGVEYKDVSRKDIKTRKPFDIMVSTAGSEMTMEQTEKRNKLTFLTNNKQNTVINPQVAIEMEATIAGFNNDEVKALLDKDYGNAELMAECARDIQNIIGGKKVEPNEAANTAYAQKLLDFMRNNRENLKDEQYGNLVIYMEAIQPIITRNMARGLNKELISGGMPSLGASAMEDVAGPEQMEEVPQLTQQAEPLEY